MNKVKEVKFASLGTPGRTLSNVRYTSPIAPTGTTRRSVSMCRCTLPASSHDFSSGFEKHRLLTSSIICIEISPVSHPAIDLITGTI